MVRRYVVSLNPEERESLLRLIGVGKGAARKLAHARILLKADEAVGPRVTDEEIATALEVSDDTVARVRRRFVEEGLEAALERKPAARPPRERVIDGAAEAKLVALCCGAAPEGRARWTLQLLADKLVELEIVESVSYETVRQTLKKTNSSPGSSGSGAFPPSRTPPSSVTWKTCSKRITCPTTRSTRSSAWTKPASNS
jgi:transposase